MEYYNNQPFNDNYLRPCPMLENPDALPAMVERSCAHCTNLTAQESAEDLCAKCRDFAEEWSEPAKKIWEDPDDPMSATRHHKGQGMSESDKVRLKAFGRKLNKFPDEEGDLPD